MAQVLVVADDLTGANACAAGFAGAGLRTVTVGLGRGWDAVTEFHPRFDVLVATTGTRHASPARAAATVDEVVRAGWPVDLLSSRIDTTLRGNVGAAAQALLSAARELSSRRVVGLCSPAHPEAGRQTVDGMQLLHGVRLENTELARDAQNPMHTSSVSEILRSGTALVTASIPVSQVTSSPESLVGALRDAVQTGADVVIADALTPEHLGVVARAAAAVLDTGEPISWVGIDPGPGSLALAAALGVQASATARPLLGGSDSVTSTTGRPLLAVSGSVTSLTLAQLGQLCAQRPVDLLRPRYADDGSIAVDATSAALIEALSSADTGRSVLLATAMTDSDVRDLDQEEAERLPSALGSVVRRALDEVGIAGLYTTGGDVTAAVVEAVGARGIQVEEEIFPLAVAGTLVDGPLWGTMIVTKGGLIGDTDGAVTCIDHLARATPDRSPGARSALCGDPYQQQT